MVTRFRNHKYLGFLDVKKRSQSGVVAQPVIPAIKEVEIWIWRLGGGVVDASPGKKLLRPHINH
jgi:hypothetical protein